MKVINYSLEQFPVNRSANFNFAGEAQDNTVIEIQGLPTANCQLTTSIYLYRKIASK